MSPTYEHLTYEHPEIQMKLNRIHKENFMPGFKAAKGRLTLMHGGNAAGDYKLKPLLAHHLERVLQKLHCLLCGSVPKAWVTVLISENWFYHHFVLEVRFYCSKKNS